MNPPEGINTNNVLSHPATTARAREGSVKF
jgi:hypothetical protein